MNKNYRSPLLFLIRDDGKNGKKLGSRLMEDGHTVFLSDSDEDLEFFGDVVDGFVEISAGQSADGQSKAVLYELADRIHPSRRALRECAVIMLPADDEQLATFTDNLADTLYPSFPNLSFMPGRAS